MMLFSFEHDVPQIDTEITLKIFEMIVTGIHKKKLSERITVERRNLIHPAFQVLKVVGWEIWN